MKIDNRTIAILLAAAAAAYFLWKRGKNGEAGQPALPAEAPAVKSSVDLADYESIVDNLGCVTPLVASSLKKNCASLNANKTNVANILEKAKKDGQTYTARLVIDASWCLADSAVITWDKHDQIRNSVLAMFE